MIPPTVCTLSLCSPRMSCTSSRWKSPWAWWWPSAARRPSSSPSSWTATVFPFWVPALSPSTWQRTGNGSMPCWSGSLSNGLRAGPSPVCRRRWTPLMSWAIPCCCDPPTSSAARTWSSPTTMRTCGPIWRSFSPARSKTRCWWTSTSWARNWKWTSFPTARTS